MEQGVDVGKAPNYRLLRSSSVENEHVSAACDRSSGMVAAKVEVDHDAQAGGVGRWQREEAGIGREDHASVVHRP